MMSNDGLLAQTSQLVNCKGSPCDYGCTVADIEAMIVHAKHLFPDKPYRVVSHWCWADVEIDPRQIEKLHLEGVQPAFVYADKIVRDEAAPWDKGLSVRTTLLVGFHKECIFSTRNTNYILVGTGSRMTVHPAVYSNLFF